MNQIQMERKRIDAEEIWWVQEAVQLGRAVAGDAEDVEEAEDTAEEHRMGNTRMDIANKVKVASLSEERRLCLWRVFPWADL